MNKHTYRTAPPRCFNGGHTENLHEVPAGYRFPLLPPFAVMALVVGLWVAS